MTITRENKNSVDQGFIISPSFIEFSKAVLKQQYGGYLPVYEKHPQSVEIKQLINLFSEKSITDSLAHDPRSHSFNVAAWNDFSLGYAYLVIAFEYIKSLGETGKNIDGVQLKARLNEAFNSQFVRKEKIIVIDMSPFFPLSTEVLLEFVIPHVLVSQARKFLKEYAPEELSKLELQLQSQLYVEQVRKIFLTSNAKWTGPFYEKLSHTKNTAFKRELFRDVAQELWRECYPQATLQFSNMMVFMQHIVMMFAEGGSLFKRYTKPLSHQYQISSHDLAHNYFPVLVSQFACESTPSPTINQVPLLVKSAAILPVAKMKVQALEKSDSTTNKVPKDAKGTVNTKALEAAQFKAMLNMLSPSRVEKGKPADGLASYMQEGYMQVPKKSVDQALAQKPEIKTPVEIVSKQLQKVSGSVMRFFSRQFKTQFGQSPPKQNINSHPSFG